MKIKTIELNSKDSGRASFISGDRISVKVMAHERIALYWDGVKFSGVELLQGKRITIKKVNSDLVLEREGEPLAILENFYGAEGAALDGAGWQFDNMSALQVQGDGVVALPVSIGSLTTMSLLGTYTALAGAAIGGLVLKDHFQNQRVAELSPQARAMAKITAYAQDSAAPAPTLKDYQDAGVTGMVEGVDGNLTQINSALASSVVTGTQVSTLAKLQAIVQAYKVIALAADGLADQDAHPTQSDYSLIGVTGVDSLAKLSLMGDVIDGKTQAEVNTVAQLQSLADATAHLMAAAGGSSTEIAALTLGGPDHSGHHRRHPTKL